MVEVNTCVILDVSTASLTGVVVTSQGSLVFQPYLSATLTLRSGYIRVSGVLRVGSERCRFVGEAEIILTGEWAGNQNVPFCVTFCVIIA